MIRPIFVKLGGSVLTDKTNPEALASATLANVAHTLAAFVAAHPAQPLLIGHGGGSFGHYWAQRYNTASGARSPEDWAGVVRVSDAMARLNRAVVGALVDAGVPALGMQPSASALARNGALETLAIAPLASLLAVGVVPVIYGDVVLDAAQGCAIISTEGMFAHIAPALAPSRIILVGEDAVFDADPRSVADARPISRIDAANYAAVLARLGGSHGADVTGGMRSKVEAMWRLASQAPGMEIAICGPDALADALAGRPLAMGTVVAP